MRLALFLGHWAVFCVDSESFRYGERRTILNCWKIRTWWQCHRITEWPREGSPHPTPAQGRTPRAGCPGPCAGLKVSKEEIHNLWAVCASVLPPTQHRNSSSRSEGTSRPLVYICCLLSKNWASLKWAWLHLLCTLPSGILYALMRLPMSHFLAEHPSSLSLSSRESTPVPYPQLWPFAGLFTVLPMSPCTGYMVGEVRTGYSITLVGLL